MNSTKTLFVLLVLTCLGLHFLTDPVFCALGGLALSQFVILREWRQTNGHASLFRYAVDVGEFAAVCAFVLLLVAYLAELNAAWSHWFRLSEEVIIGLNTLTILLESGAGEARRAP